MSRKNKMKSGLPAIIEKDKSQFDTETEVHKLRKFHWVPTKLITALVLMFSITIHLAVIQAVATKLPKQTEKQSKPQNLQIVEALPKKTPEPPKPKEQKKVEEQKIKKEKIVRKKHENKVTKREKKKMPVSSRQKTKVAQNQTKKIAASRQREAIGKRYMSKVIDGSFPRMTLDYSDPQDYMRHMYQAGAVTLVLNPDSRKYYNLDLFTGAIIPVNLNELMGSHSMYVISVEDTTWDRTIKNLKLKWGLLDEAIEIKMLLPLSVHQRWIGHQVETFSKLGIQDSNVVSVDASVNHGKFRITSIFMKDGNSLRNLADSGV